MTNASYLIHYGVKGQQWGKRQYQNLDGSLTTLGRSHYGYGNSNNMNTAGIAAQQTAKNIQKYGLGGPKVSGGGGTVTPKNGTSNTKGLMTMDEVRKINDANSAAYKGGGSEEEEDKEKKKKGKGKSGSGSGKKGSSSKKSETPEEKEANKTDMDIVKSALGNNFDSIKEKVAAKFKETGKTTLTNDEIKEILGNDFESVRDNVKKQVSDRDAAKKKVKESKSKSSDEKKSIKSKSSKEIKDLAYKMASGEFGKTDADMKEALGDDYTKVKKEYDKMKANADKITAKAKAIKHSINMYSHELVTTNTSSYLMHHGVGGQKWGKRNGPPYPLNASDHSASERKAGTHGWTAEAKAEANKNQNKRPSSEIVNRAKNAKPATEHTKSGNRKISYSRQVARREALKPEEEKKKFSLENVDKKKVMTGAAIAATVAAGAFFLGTPVGRAAMNKAVSALPSVAEKAGGSVGRVVGKGAAKATNILSSAASRGATAALEGAMASVGGIAIVKLAQKMDPGPDAPQSVKDRNKVALDAASAGIEAATKTKLSGNNNIHGSGNLNSKAINDKVGAPSNKYVDRSSSEYQALFKDSNDNQRSEEERATIKSMAKAGYDIDQIRKYLE